MEVDWYFRCDDNTLRADSHAMRWANELVEAMESFGRPIRTDSHRTRQRLTEAGFVDIQEEVIKMPVNGWPSDQPDRDIGRWFNLGLRQTYQPLALAPLYRGQGLSLSAVQDLAEKVRLELYHNRVHAYCTM